MASTISKQLTARAVFPDAARAAFADTDQPITTRDAVTGITLTYRFEPHAGGVLRLTGGPFGQTVLTVACDEADRDLVATLLVDGIAHQMAQPAPVRRLPAGRWPG